jgi:hypothetical protein
MDDARGQESHFDSWLTQNEGICKAIDSLKILDTPPAAQPAYCSVKTVHEGKPVYTQGFEPDWANFQEGRAVGWTEAMERIIEKVKSMPWESDTKDSFLIWLKEQNT